MAQQVQTLSQSQEPTDTVSSSEAVFVRWFHEIGLADVPIVGGKNASLGELYRELTKEEIKVPNGFAITVDAYRHFLRASNLSQGIEQLLAGLDKRDVHALNERGRRIRDAILAAPIPEDLSQAILDAYAELSGDPTQPIDVAVRSSATAEDLPDASFAGQQETYLNVRGRGPLLEACRRCFASLFTDRAISYRCDKGFDPLKVGISVGIQQMVRSDLASSGVMFSIDTETGFKDVVLINAAYGLGENVVQGSVNPDEYYVFKPTLQQGFRPIVKKQLGSKEMKLVYDVGGTKAVKNVPVPQADRSRFALSDDDVLTLARWACRIENHYSSKRQGFCPMDIEWAKDGETGELFIVQARPETVQSQRKAALLEEYHLKERGPIIVRGRAVGSKIASGPVRIVRHLDELEKFLPGEVLVADKTDPDWEPVMKKAVAIVTNRGGRTCHAAIVSRELGLPAVIGTQNATDLLSDGDRVTVSCAEGETGIVYSGELPFEVTRIDIAEQSRPRTKVMINLGNPDEALRLAQLPNDGVGLARLEFIIGTRIKVHPMALVHYDELTDPQVKDAIQELTSGYASKSEFFIDQLAQGVALIAAAFYPKDVIVRLSDFKTNEYAGLLGGEQFEPKEENPMLGFRGASRYYDARFRDAFALECLALKRVRDEMGLINVKLMIPFCRTIQEAQKVQAEMARHGLKRGQNGLDLYVMCELPSNIACAAEFAQHFDGFSIGSNDLTQLMLGVDRDSEIVAHLFDERDLAVKRVVAHVIQEAKEAGCKIGICGQAPSDYPEFAEFLVEQGIDSMSLSADAVLRTTAMILDIERRSTAASDKAHSSRSSGT